MARTDRFRYVYDVYGVKELLSSWSLKPEDMQSYKIKVVGRTTYTFERFLPIEVEIEFKLRDMGYTPGEAKEAKRIEFLKKAGYGSAVTFWKVAMADV